MNGLPLILITAAVLLFLPAALRTGGRIRYNRRRRKRGKRPLGPDPLTVILYIAAGVCLAAGILTAGHKTTPAAPTEPTPAPTLQTQAPTDPTQSPTDPTQAPTELTQPPTEPPTDPTEAATPGPRPDVLLVNPWNPVPEGYAPDLVALDEYYGVAGMQVDRSCYAALMEMIDACNAAGSRAYVLSSYRTYEHQQRLYNRKVEKLMAAGRSRADAEKEAATVVVLPGTSEHHLGLAVDIIDTRLWALEEEQEDLPAQRWLMENSWRYGFILRYPKDKTAVTGVIYEPWHYRYVGTELAAAIYESGLTLEEYLDSFR